MSQEVELHSDAKEELLIIKFQITKQQQRMYRQPGGGISLQ